jgi:ubiquinone/menaquinone biosynthesis C-methylase UbiE
MVVCVGLVLLCSGVDARQLGTLPAGEWIKVLDSPDRIARLRVDQVVAALKLKPGDVVADLGAGSGLFTFPIARAVTAQGKVYAVEVDDAFLTHIRSRAREQKVTQIETVRGRFADPALPSQNVDVAFIMDTLHHIEDRANYLKSAAGYLRRGGRLIVVDYHPERSSHKNEPKLVVSKSQTSAWLEAAGLTPLEDLQLFDDKWFLVYTKK